MHSSRNLLYVLNILIAVSFFAGFILSENSAGGGEGDINHIKTNYDLIFQNSLKDINWKVYDSSRYPFHYFFTKIYLPFDYVIIKLNNFFLSLLTPIIFFFVLKNKSIFNNEKKENIIYISTSILIFLSPYFRTSAFWMLEENFGIFFLSISTLFLYLSFNQKNNKFILIFLNILFLYFSFFSSQNLFVFVIVNYFFYIKFFWKEKSKIFIITLLNIFFFVGPYIVFRDILFEISHNVTTARLYFDYFKFVEIFSILLIYIFPIYILNFRFKEIVLFFRTNYILLFISYFVYLFIFFNYDSEFLGGGMVKKFLYIIFKEKLIYNYFLISFSYLGIIFFFHLSLYKDLKLLLFTPYFILLTLTDYVFQEYLDPIFLIFVIFYTNLINIQKLTRIFKLKIYFIILLISANIYYLY